MIKERLSKELTDQELRTLSGGFIVGSVCRPRRISLRGFDIGPTGRVSIAPNPSPAPHFKRNNWIGIAPLPSP